MGAPQKADWREERSQRAWGLQRQGWVQKDIAGALGVSEGAVSQWLGRGREQGVEALKRRPPPGMTPRLSSEQRAQIPLLLAHGAPTYGFDGEVWTAKRVAQVIERTFGVRYHPDHLSRRLRQSGCSRHHPLTPATHHHAATSAAWHEERWPARKKGRSKRERPSAG